MFELDGAKLIFEMINSAIYKEYTFKEDCSKTDWELIYNIAKRNQLISLLYDASSRLSKEYKIPDDLIKRWKESAVFNSLIQKEKYKAMCNVLKLAKEQGIKFVLFKGYVLAELYPNFSTRLSSDTDIFVYERDKEKAIALFESLGYDKNIEDSKEQVYVYFLKSSQHVVELHFSLWEDYKGSKIDMLEGMNIVDEDSLIRIDICNVEVYTLGYEEHLIYQMFHIIKHFSLQGISIRYLIDITLYINKYEECIDFESFWNKTDELGYSYFCETFFNICVNYLKMSSKILKGRKVIKDTDTLLYDLINVGSVFETSEEWSLLSILTPYFSGEKEIPKSKFVRNVKILFPSSGHLPKAYAYANRFKILLPIAWIHRFIYYMIKRLVIRKDIYNAKEKLSIAEHRLSLLRSLGLINTEEK